MFLGCIRSGAIILSTNGLALFGICCYIANFSELPPIITEIRCYHSALDIGPCVYFTKTISKPESNFWPCKVSTKACAYEPIWIFLNSVFDSLGFGILYLKVYHWYRLRLAPGKCISPPLDSFLTIASVTIVALNCTCVNILDAKRISDQ